MRKSAVGGLLLALVASLTTWSATPASAEVKGDLRLVGERPVRGTFDLKYNNYREQKRTCRPHVCTPRGYRVARGEMRVKLRTYRVVESLRKYDYYVLDVDVVNADRYGSSKKGWAKVHIAKASKIKWVDYGDTSSVSATEADCTEIGLSMGGSVGPGGASISWGSVRFCDDEASYAVERREGKTTTYLAAHTREISHYSSQRLVKVRRGKRPTFKVSVHVPTDKCTDAEDGNCVEYTNDTNLVSYRIKSDG